VDAAGMACERGTHVKSSSEEGRNHHLDFPLESHYLLGTHVYEPTNAIHNSSKTVLKMDEQTAEKRAFLRSGEAAIPIM
jgi:hypothetical protein